MQLSETSVNFENFILSLGFYWKLVFLHQHLLNIEKFFMSIHTTINHLVYFTLSHLQLQCSDTQLFLFYVIGIILFWIVGEIPVIVEVETLVTLCLSFFFPRSKCVFFGIII